MQGEALTQIQSLVQQAVAQDWRPLPQTTQKAAAFQDSVNVLVFDVLMDKVLYQQHTCLLLLSDCCSVTAAQ